eukprot:1158027-Pelagomonas_calceolata.AAC.17
MIPMAAPDAAARQVGAAVAAAPFAAAAAALEVAVSAVAVVAAAAAAAACPGSPGGGGPAAPSLGTKDVAAAAAAAAAACVGACPLGAVGAAAVADSAFGHPLQQARRAWVGSLEQRMRQQCLPAEKAVFLRHEPLLHLSQCLGLCSSATLSGKSAIGHGKTSLHVQYFRGALRSKTTTTHSHKSLACRARGARVQQLEL